MSVHTISTGPTVTTDRGYLVGVELGLADVLLFRLQMRPLRGVEGRPEVGVEGPDAGPPPRVLPRPLLDMVLSKKDYACARGRTLSAEHSHAMGTHGDLKRRYLLQQASLVLSCDLLVQAPNNNNNRRVQFLPREAAHANMHPIQGDRKSVV